MRLWKRNRGLGQSRVSWRRGEVVSPEAAILGALGSVKISGGGSRCLKAWLVVGDPGTSGRARPGVASGVVRGRGCVQGGGTYGRASGSPRDKACPV